MTCPQPNTFQREDRWQEDQGAQSGDPEHDQDHHEEGLDLRNRYLELIAETRCGHECGFEEGHAVETVACLMASMPPSSLMRLAM